jgi:hypothetical protein
VLQKLSSPNGAVGIQLPFILVEKGSDKATLLSSSIPTRSIPRALALGNSSPTISAKPVGVGAASQRLILAGEQSGLLTHIAATESRFVCELMKSSRRFWNSNRRFARLRRLMAWHVKMESRPRAADIAAPQ